MLLSKRNNHTLRSSSSRRLNSMELLESRRLLTGDAMLVPVDDHGDTAIQATQFEIGSTQLGGIQFLDDSDWFSFEVKENETYLVEINSPRQVVSVQIVTDDETSIVPPEYSAVTLFADADRTLFVKVDGRDFNTLFEYNLTIRRLDDVDRHGESILTATPIEVSSGFITEGEIQTQQEQDWFSFDVVQGNTYEITKNAFENFGFELIEPDGSTMTFDTGDFTQNFSWMASETGTAFLVAKSDQDTQEFFPIRYALQVDLPNGDDHGETVATATPLNLPNSGVGTISSNDRDWFSFSVEAGETYVITIDAQDTFLRLLNDRGRLIRASEEFTIVTSIVWEAPTSGTFFVEVSPTELAMEFGDFEQRYVLNIERVSDTDGYGDSLETATPIQVPGIIADIVDFPGESDWVSFEVEANAVYEFFGSTSGALPNFRLVDAAGTELLSNDIFESVLSFRATKDETLFLGILGEDLEVVSELVFAS